MKLTIPAYVKTVMDVLQARGFQAHVVGVPSGTCSWAGPPTTMMW